jgi:hypothetical protein
MKFIPKTTLTAALLIAAATLGRTTPAQAFSFYFGEDLSSNENVRLTVSPKADAARTEFLSRLVDVGTETFESAKLWTEAPLSISFGSAGNATMGGDGYIATTVTNDGSAITPTGTNRGRYPISGTQYWEAWEEFSIDFSKPIAALGFYGTDIGDINGNLTLTLLNSLTGFEQNITVNHTSGWPANMGGSVLYFGLIADASQVFNKVTFTNNSGGTDAFGFDNMTIGGLDQVALLGLAGGIDQVASSGLAGGIEEVASVSSEPVPEPLTMAGMALGGAMLTGARRFRQRQQKAVVEKD